MFNAEWLSAVMIEITAIPSSAQIKLVLRVAPRQHVEGRYRQGTATSNEGSSDVAE